MSYEDYKKSCVQNTPEEKHICVKYNDKYYDNNGKVVSYDDLMKEGSMNMAREKGLVRSEGKEYIMKDGDIVLFKFNV